MHTRQALVHGNIHIYTTNAHKQQTYAGITTSYLLNFLPTSLVNEAINKPLLDNQTSKSKHIHAHEHLEIFLHPAPCMQILYRRGCVHCICVCVRACVFLCVFMCVHVCVYALCVCVCRCACAYMCICVLICVLCVCICVCVTVCVHVYVFVP